MSGLFGKAPKPEPPPPPPPAIADEAVGDAAEIERLRKRRGRAATLLTSGEGITSVADVARKTLLGQ